MLKRLLFQSISLPGPPIIVENVQKASELGVPREKLTVCTSCMFCVDIHFLTLNVIYL